MLVHQLLPCCCESTPVFEDACPDCASSYSARFQGTVTHSAGTCALDETDTIPRVVNNPTSTLYSHTEDIACSGATGGTTEMTIELGCLGKLWSPSLNRWEQPGDTFPGDFETRYMFYKSVRCTTDGLSPSDERAMWAMLTPIEDGDCILDVTLSRVYSTDSPKHPLAPLASVDPDDDDWTLDLS